MNPFTIKNNYIRYICTTTDAGNKNEQAHHSYSTSFSAYLIL